jgi:hypothetical protein
VDDLRALSLEQLESQLVARAALGLYQQAGGSPARR